MPNKGGAEGRQRLRQLVAEIDRLLLANQTTIDSADQIAREDVPTYRRLKEDPRLALVELGDAKFFEAVSCTASLALAVGILAQLKWKRQAAEYGAEGGDLHDFQL